MCRRWTTATAAVAPAAEYGQRPWRPRNAQLDLADDKGTAAVRIRGR